MGSVGILNPIILFQNLTCEYTLEFRFWYSLSDILCFEITVRAPVPMVQDSFSSYKDRKDLYKC